MTEKLNARQKLFAEEWVKDMNGTQAAIRAGYSKKTAYAIANQLLNNLEVALYVAKLQEERSARNAIDADYVLRRLSEMDEMDVADIMDDEGNVRPLSEWPKVWRRSLNALEVSEIMRGGDVVGVLKKVKWPDKTRILEMIGKHVGVGAFRDRVEHTGKGGGPIETVTMSRDEYKAAREEMLGHDDC